ncbi:MAG: hypothetical protein PHU81_09565 [Acidobacteriota bacterium]|nr:hypothetical protein [Acidobacteriota bacterium]
MKKEFLSGCGRSQVILPYLSYSKYSRCFRRQKCCLPGFSLLESLISLTLSLFILISALEVMTQAKRIYSRCLQEQEASLGAAVAMEKIREDLEQAGTGLEGNRPDEGFWPVKIDDSAIILFSGEIPVELAADIEAGQNWALIRLWPGSVSSLKNGRLMLFTGQRQTDLVKITGVLYNRLTVSPSFSSSYEANEAGVYLLEKTEFYLDSREHLLRRRVNGTSGQPLLENVNWFQPAYSRESNLVSIRFGTGSVKEKIHELFFFPKNTAQK